MKNPILEQARALEKTLRLDEQARAARRAYCAKYQGGQHKFFGSYSLHARDGVEIGMTVHIALGQYLAQYPDAEPKVREYEANADTHERKTCMCYPSKLAGDIRPGFSVWVESSTPWITIPGSIVQNQPATQAA